jgi:hypothetical protein
MRPSHSFGTGRSPASGVWALERRQLIGPRGWKTAVLRDDTWEFLNALPFLNQLAWAGQALTVYHGSPGSDTEYVTPYKPLPASVEHHWEVE